MRRWKSLSTGAKYIFAATCVAGAFAATTTDTKADGMAAKGRPAAVVPTSWSGFYFGVAGGYQWSSMDVDIPGSAGTLFDVNQDTAFAGVHLGVQHQFGAVVLGIEGGWMSTFRDDPGSTRCPPLPSTLDCNAQLNDILTIGGRLGWAAGHWMPYLTGGYATARFNHEVRAAATGVLDNTAGTRNDGWYLGGGFEWAVTPGWTAGLEYRHYEFDDATGPASTPAGVFVNDRRIDASTDTIAARVSWRWDIPGRGAPARPLK